MKLSGRCLCERVSYTYEGDVTTSFLCHCEDCRRSSGSAFHHGVMVNEDGFEVSGETKQYAKKSDADRDIVREFCGDCGSGVFNRIEMAPGKIIIRAGTLDDASPFPPRAEFYSHHTPGWLDTGELKRPGG